MTTGKKIYLYITPFFPSPNSWRGGYCFDAVNALTRTGKFNVIVFVPGDGEDYTYKGVVVHRFKINTLPCGVLPFIFAKSNCRSFVNKVRDVGIDLNEVAYCHVNTVDLGFTLAAFDLLKTTVRVLQHHRICPIRLDCGRLGQIPIHSTLLYLYWCRICEKVDVHVFCSFQSRGSFARLYHKDIPELGFEDMRSRLLLGRWLVPLSCYQSVVWYNGIDSTIFNRHVESKPEDRMQAVKQFVIGCVANFQPLKDQMTLLRAVKRLLGILPDFKVRFVGTGTMLQDCQTFVNNNGLSEIVSFEKEMDHLDLPKFYHGLDLFVLPSRTEAFCCSYIEAIGCGIPVMGCKGVSVQEAILKEDWDKWLAMPQDDADLARLIVEYYRSRYLFRLARSFDIDDLACEYLGVCEKFSRNKEV